jgi:hypothetical protein
MWGHSADGVEWMYKTPRVVLIGRSFRLNSAAKTT